MLTCSVESLAAEAITSSFLRREMFVMGGYPPVAEQTSMVFLFSFVPFNCRVIEGCSVTERVLVMDKIFYYSKRKYSLP